MTSAPPSPPTLDLFVAARSDGVEGIATLTLASPDGAALPAWEPGAHVDLLLADDLVRQYSLCGDPADRYHWTVAVLREPAGRGGSERLHRELVTGARVRARGPRNNFRLHPSASYLFIAGGIGITPLLPMIRAVDREDADWRLVYGGRRRRDSMAFLEVLEPLADRVAVWPQETSGLLDVGGILDEAPAGTLVYCCGPEGLLTAVELACRERPRLTLHVERFAPRAADLVLPAESDREVVVECRRSGVTVTVGPGESILAAIQQAGAQLFGSCLSGTCGTCEAGVLDGVPLHRDAVLSAEERAVGDVMFPCVSRAATPRLVLDV